MATRKTTEQFIIDAKKAHGDRYDYSNVEYLGNKKKIVIKCSIHGDFLQVPSWHLRGGGCSKCQYILLRKAFASNKKTFIEKSNLKHNFFYDYSHVKYINAHKKVIITCNKHGNFEQSPDNHLQGKGCIKCGKESMKKKLTSNNDIFVFEAKKIHGNKYNYEKSLFIKTTEKVIIICKKHGEFLQIPTSHLLGIGCKKCGFDKSAEYKRNKPTCFNDALWQDYSLKSKSFDSYKVYLVKFSNENEVFYKIGKTFNTTKKRLSTTGNYYKKIIIKEIQNDDYKIISQLERELHIKNKHLKYIPKHEFHGMYECFKFTDQIIFE